MNNAAGATYVLAFSGWHETGEKGITVDRHTGLAKRRLGDRVVLWEVVVLHNIANIGHNIVWIEQMVSKSEAIQLYSHCAVFCCPSVYEPFGIINLEAMACRAPVVASATGGILEVVVDGETGCLVPFTADPVTTFPDKPEQFSRDLAARITELLKDPARAKAMGEAGRKRVEEHFSCTAIAAQTKNLYEELIAAKKR